jgi:hypothetical protein
MFGLGSHPDWRRRSVGDPRLTLSGAELRFDSVESVGSLVRCKLMFCEANAGELFEVSKVLLVLPGSRLSYHP